jgi:eukaryotic-like serine/threonine-protein kinase
MSFGVNEVVGDYECLAIIEKPRSGVTYKVRNRRTGELESLRALPGATARDPESSERLLREIRVHARLTHPNLIAFHDAFELAGQVVMTTDYLEGPTVAQLCNGRPLPPDRAAAIVIAVLRGLDEAHALGIVHRGISADHVIVATDGTVKLGGFDLAKPASGAELTKLGAVIGDPRYISPEQVIGKAVPDARSDLYSVGILLYFVLTGKMPFEGRTDFDILSAQVSADPERPATLNPAIPRALEEVVLRALRKNPDERFASAADFEQALSAAIAAPATTPPAAAPVPAPAAQPVAAPRRLAVPVVAGLALILALALWMVLR